MATNGMEIKVGADVKGAVAGINTLNKSLKTLPSATGQATQSLTNFGRVVQDAPFGIIGIANNIDPLIQSFNQLKATTGSASAAFSALGSSLLGPAGIAIAISTITSLLVVYSQKKQQAASATKNLKNETSELDKVISSATKAVVDESGKVAALVTGLQSLTLTRVEQKRLLDELNKIAPQYFGNLSKEKDLVDALSTAYFFYKQGISQAIQSKLLEADLNILTGKLEKIEKIFKGINDKADLRKITGSKPSDQRGLFVDEQGIALDINLLYKERASLQAAIFGIQQKINTAGGTYVQHLLAGNTSTKETKKSNDDLILGYVEINGALVKNIELIIKQKEEQAKFNAEVLKQAPGRKPGSQLTERLEGNAKGGGLFGLDQLEGLDKLNEKLLNTKDLINNGINGGIDTFFNAIANNQDPFKALAQSAARLVTELGAAVVKALLLKVITKAISGGIGGGADRALAGFGKGLSGGGAVRGDIMRLAMFR